MYTVEFTVLFTILKRSNETKTESKNKLGFLLTSAFFYAFKLGIMQEDEVLSTPKE